ncbi:MAG: SusC/RagA family TonB-linked outer membrane protein [Gemmatimonadetes bacterium]|nr:SusC/RagA family TonB-linked outer membrane protein [Gemmatimonadota bacterium]
MAPPRLLRVARGVAASALLLLLAAWPAAAQGTGTVRGTVTDAVTRRPLAGAQVSIVGTRIGALTNGSGVYVIPGVPAGSHTVRVDDIGFKTVEKPVTVTAEQAATVDFELTQSAIALDEVVVTGTPGATTKRTVGNSVSQIDASRITQAAPTENVQQLLAARTPGLTLLANAGNVGTSSRIRIRGAGSVNAGNQPVIYVDGVRISSATQTGFGVSDALVQGTSPLDAINPADIESIEVIKGPAAATLYGAEAANGVIQIITKRGRGGGGLHWNMSYDQGVMDWALPQPVNYTLCSMPHAAGYPGCQGKPPETLLVQTPLTKDPNPPIDPVTGQPDPRSGMSYIRQGSLSDLNLSVQGGGQSYSFYVSGERNVEDGVMVNNFSKRTSARANFSIVPSEKVNFTISTGYANSHIRLPLADNASNSILRVSNRGRPGASATYRQGYLGLDPAIGNEYNNQTWQERTTLGLTANFNPFSWWTNKLTLGMDKNDRFNQELYTIDDTGKQPWGAEVANGAVYQWLPTDHVWTVDYASTFTRKLNESYTSAFSVGMQYNRKQYRRREVDGIGFVSDQVNTIGSAAITRGDESFSEQSSLGFFGQEQVGWKDRLFVTGAVRVDNNSAFGSDVKLVTYPKASVSYVISDEPWFHLPSVDQLKLRGAWGRAGRAPDPFTADRTFSGEVATVAGPTGDVSVNQVEPSSYGNPNLKAETGQELELGFEASLAKGRLGLDFTYYNQRTKDALMSIDDPRSAGFTGSHLVNIGEVANSGIELSLTATPVYLHNVQWDATLGVSTNHNKLVRFGTGQTSIDFGSFATVQRHVEGYPLGGYWATDVKRDANGNPIVTKDSRGMYVAQVDPEMKYVGPSMPTRNVAFTNTVTLFGNLKLYAHLDYQGGNYMWCAICSLRNRTDHNAIEVNRPLLTTADSIEYAVRNSLETKLFITKADFIKLREVSATYNLPTRYVRSFGASAASITLAARNLWMWTSYVGAAGKGKSDPEVSFSSTSNFSLTDYDGVPMLRRLVATARVSF